MPRCIIYWVRALPMSEFLQHLIDFYLARDGSLLLGI
jgi:hypothetical protein